MAYTPSTSLLSFLEALTDPSRPVSAELVDALRRENPWFTLPSAVRLERTSDLGADERRRLARKVVLSTASRESILSHIDPDGTLWASFYPADNGPRRPDTVDAISTFLETYGHGASAEDDALLERLIFNPQPDYASVLEEQYGNATEPATDEHTALIDAFLSKPHTLPAEPVAPAPEPAEPVTPAAQTPAAPESSLSESLAKIYIRQRRYDKAFDIINNLNLNFPEKSAYFADQLRFLRKLMLNDKAAKGGKNAKTNNS